ncbi:MAG: leucine-rich repeat domain-containing protein [Spirochaetaceae bacterium]|jgi:hypothetical protein|nr:leucine-rich repeat domain-containing protein [Spirochaetaceae bacterium]
MKTTMKSGSLRGGLGIATAPVTAALFVAITLVLAGCENPEVPSADGGDTSLPFGAVDTPPAPSVPWQAALGEIEPYTAAIYLAEDGEELPTEEELSAFARSVAGPTKERINGDNIRNYVQVITVDKADGTVAGLFEARRISASQPMPGIKVRGLVRGHSYGIMLLQGHWERDYAAETEGGDYAYTANPPTLLSVGYQEVTYTVSGSIKITVWPIYVDTRFTAGGITAEPVVKAGKPEAISLQASSWTVNWKVLRGASGTASGFGDLITAQRAAGSPGESLIVTDSKAVVWTGEPGASAPEVFYTLALTYNTITLPMEKYTGISRIGKTGAVNFELSFVPFNLRKGWAAHVAASLFDLEAGPPEWVIRNGVNDLAQDNRTDFTNFGNKPVTEANGNGALRFTVANPSPAASGELIVSKGSLNDFYLTFTTAGYTGTAQAWYAAVPSGGASGGPGYAAYTPLGEVLVGTHTKKVTLPGTNGYDVYMILLKAGKAGPHRINSSPALPNTSVAAALNYLASLPVNSGSSAANPILLPVKANLGSAGNSLANLLEAIEMAGKYVDVDLSACSMSGTEFNSNPTPAASYTGKDLVVSLVLPDVARGISGDGGSKPAFKHFTSLKTVSGRGTTSVGKAAFKGCYTLTTISLPAATNIGANAFQNCTALSTLNLPAATSIDSFAFQNCTALSTLNLPAATSIGENAFLSTGPNALTVNLGANAPSLGASSAASGGYSKTITVNLPAQNFDYNGLWPVAFKKLFGGGANITLTGNKKFLSFPLTSVEAAREYLLEADAGTGSVNNPVVLQMQMYLAGGADELQRLFSMANTIRKYIYLDLSRCTSNNNVFSLNTGEGTGKDLVVSVVLPDTAWGIPDDPGNNPAFNHFNNLKSVSGAGTTYIGSWAFHRCPALETVNFPNATIGGYAFKDCTSLVSVNFPNTTGIGGYAFQDCTSLVSVNFPRVTVISPGVFLNCTSLTQVNMPAVQDIQDHAFQNTASLKTVNFPGADWIQEYAFQDSGLTVADFPRVSYIGYGAFLRSRFLQEARFPNGQILRNHAFQECSSLKKAIFPAVDNGGVGAYVFAYCTSLEYVDLSFWEPDDIDKNDGLFFQTGSTPITIVLNPLEIGDAFTTKNGAFTDDHGPDCAPYSKRVTIKHGPDGVVGSWYGELFGEVWDGHWISWFGKGWNQDYHIVEEKY